MAENGFAEQARSTRKRYEGGLVARAVVALLGCRTKLVGDTGHEAELRLESPAIISRHMLRYHSGFEEEIERPRDIEPSVQSPLIPAST